MKLLVDMNLSPAWVETLRQSGWEAVHWSTLGNPAARTPTSCASPRARLHCFTHDLDFGAMLAQSRAGKPSVFQVRVRDVSPGHLGPLVSRVLRQFSAELASGALVTVDEASQRVRLLPLTR